MAEVESLSHSGICVHDLKQAEDFYCKILGAEIHSRVNFKTQDALKGRSVHTSLQLEDYLFAIMLTEDFMDLPPADQLHGANRTRHAFAVPRDRFGDVMAALADNHIAFEGPVDHPEAGPFGQSIYFKDPSSNFLEILWRRDENDNYNEVLGMGHGSAKKTAQDN